MCEIFIFKQTENSIQYFPGNFNNFYRDCEIRIRVVQNFKEIIVDFLLYNYYLKILEAQTMHKV